MATALVIADNQRQKNEQKMHKKNRKKLSRRRTYWCQVWWYTSL